MKTYVAIGCSTMNDYAFLVPFTALLWRDHVGHEPFILPVGDWNGHSKANVALNALVHHKIAFDTPGTIFGYSDGTIAQNIRQHVAAHESIPSENWIMLADADLWPLRREFYHQHETFEGKAVLYYANGDHFMGKQDVLMKYNTGQAFQSIPTCHVTMRGKDWKEIYEINQSVWLSTMKTLNEMEPWIKRCQDQNLARWCCDQWYVTVQLCRQSWFPDAPPPRPVPEGGRVLQSDSVMMIERYGHPPVDRLDRVYPFWGKFDQHKWVDAHVHKSPNDEDHWQDELQIIDALLPQHSEWARAYREEYQNAQP